jgi:hypothetical protein
MQFFNNIWTVVPFIWIFFVFGKAWIAGMRALL